MSRPSHKQFSETVASLIASPKLASTSPPLSPPMSPGSEPHLYAKSANDAQLRGKVVIFSTSTNNFSYRTLTAGTSLRDVVLTSPRHQICSLPIKMYAKRVDLSEVGVKSGEGQVHELIKALPAWVVYMRILGWYQVLYVVRCVEDAKSGEEDD